MPVNATGRKYLSDLMKATDTFAEETAVRFNFDTVLVGGSGTIDNVGIPLIWNNVASRFEVYVAQVIATVIATGGSPLKDGSVICVSVGSKFGVGFNKADTDLTADVNMTALYRGDAVAAIVGVVWSKVSLRPGTNSEWFSDRLPPIAYSLTSAVANPGKMVVR